MSDYVQKIKHLSDSLAAVHCPVDDEDLIIHTLNGLPQEYVSFKTSIRTRSSPLTIEELHVLLLCEELSIENCQQLVTDYSTTALLASEDSGKTSTSNKASGNNSAGIYNNRGKGRNGRNNFRGRGSNSFQSRSSNDRPCRQICNRSAHTALDCYHRMDYSYQGQHPPSQLAAMAASYNLAPEQTWFADSGATDHITNDLNNLSIQMNYHGRDQVAVGNGQGLQITHTGSSVLHTPFSSFKFSKILHVPSITSNLLSVNRFTKDNDCLFIFDPNGFTIQDCQSGRTLFRGLSSNGLYPFPVSASSSNSSGSTAFLGERTSAGIWHCRLGHPSFESVRRRLLHSLPLTGSSSFTTVCEYCRIAKSCKLPFSTSDSVT